MATNKPENVENVENVEERVEIYIPRGAANDDPNLFVSVNCENFILPKGKTSKVPRYVAEEIKRSWRAQDIQDENNDKLQQIEAK